MLSHRVPRIEQARKAISERAPRIGRVVDGCAAAVAEHGPHFMAAAGLQARRVTVHRLTALMLVLACCVVLGVPQIRALFALPQSLADRALVALSALVGLSMYTAAWLAALPIDDVEEADPTLAGGDHDFVARWHRRVQPLGNAIDRALEYFDERPIVAWSLVVLALASAWSLGDTTPLLLHAFFVCAWLGLQQFRGTPRGTEKPARRAATKLIGRTTTLLLLTNVLVELVWGVQGLLGDGCEMYSMWAVMQGLFAVTLSLRAFDVLGLLGVLGPSWTRFVLALAALLLLAILPSGVQLGTPRQEALGVSALETPRAHADAGPRSRWPPRTSKRPMSK